jgi:hypothetical protein
MMPPCFVSRPQPRLPWHWPRRRQTPSCPIPFILANPSSFAQSSSVTQRPSSPARPSDSGSTWSSRTGGTSTGSIPATPASRRVSRGSCLPASRPVSCSGRCPTRFVTGPLVIFGYAGDVLLVSDVHVPASAPAGGNVDLVADVSWLACAEECIPGSASVRLSLPVEKTARPMRRRRVSSTPPKRAGRVIHWRGSWMRGSKKRTPLSSKCSPAMPARQRSRIFSFSRTIRAWSKTPHRSHSRRSRCPAGPCTSCASRVAHAVLGPHALCTAFWWRLRSLARRRPAAIEINVPVTRR